MNLQVPLVDMSVIQELQALLKLVLSRGSALLAIHLADQQSKLLSELLQRLEPEIPTMLIAVSHKESVEQLIDVGQSRFVLVVGSHELLR